MSYKINSCAVLSLLAVATGSYAAAPAPVTADQAVIEEVVVTGVRASEQESVVLKRDAASIQDSIAAEDIGRFPDTTITESLQRITGVQIDREGGEGTTINIRGLPQVGTLLNGESFVTAGSIVSVQPDFQDVPSQLFAGADVIKSPTASLLNAGITGTVNLRTWRPYDLKPEWTFAGAGAVVHGTQSDKYQPMYDGLAGFHGEHWGFLVSGSYSDVTLENSRDGADQYSGQLISETTDSTTEATGFVNAYLGKPFPSGMKLLNPTNCVSNLNGDGLYGATTPTGCDVDVNGDGKANGAFYFTPDFSALDRQIEHKRTGASASLQAELGHGLNLTSDFFYTDQRRYDRTIGYQLNTASWNGGTFLPITARNTGVQVYNDYNDPNTPTSLNDFYTTQRYQFYMGDIETYSEDLVTDSTSRNYNLEIAYDEGGKFTADVRGVYANAGELYMASYLQYANSNGQLWPNEATNPPPPGTMVFPGGNRVFNPYGMDYNVVPATVDLTGNHMGITLPSSLAATLQNPNAWALKTVTSEGDYDRSSTLQLLRADGHYKFSDHPWVVDFGLRHSDNSAENTNFALIAPVFGSSGTYNNVVDSSGNETNVQIPNTTGCYVHYKASDVLLDGGQIPGACKGGDPVNGFWRANPLGALNPSQLPSIVANNTKLYNNLAKVEGIGVWTLDPKIMDDVLAFQNTLYPGEIRDVDPGGTWRVDVHQTTGYVQGNFKGTVVYPFSGNIGLKVIRTDLNIDQHKAGTSGPYYVSPQDLGVTETDRSFTDTLPVVNLAIDVRNNVRVRLAYSKNMQLLNLDQWGGGLTLDYAIVAGTSPPIARVVDGTQNGNPELDPWRSSNYDMSVEYYINHSSMVSLAAFYVNVDSFISQGSVVRCDLPDQDGVVRNRCVPINGPIQGAGKSLHGLEFGWKQAFDFLPGRFSNLGIDANYTYSPSNTGKDIAGNTIPFQDNSKEQANIILWYQQGPFQARVAGNYRSERAVAENYGGITGFEEYQQSTFYLDASASFDFAKHFTVFAEGSNLTNEQEHYYLVWTDQKLNTTQYEPRYTLGVRAKY